MTIHNPNQPFFWRLPGDWGLKGVFGSDGLRQYPEITLCKYVRRKDGTLDLAKCTERLTPWNENFQDVLRRLLTDLGEARNASSDAISGATP